MGAPGDKVSGDGIADNRAVGRSAPDDSVFVGRIAKAFGIRGEVAVDATGDDPKRFAPQARVFLGAAESESGARGAGAESLTVASCRTHLGRFLIRFVEVPDRNGAEALMGRELYLAAEALPALPVGTYYHFQLIGLEVKRADGRSIGRVERVLQAGDGDLYRVAGPDGEWLIPARKEFVARIDLAAKTITLTPRDDLFAAQSRDGHPDDGDLASPAGGSMQAHRAGAHRAQGNPERARRPSEQRPNERRPNDQRPNDQRSNEQRSNEQGTNRQGPSGRTSVDRRSGGPKSKERESKRRNSGSRPSSASAS